MEDVGEEFITETEAVASAESGGDLGADHDFPVGKGEDVGGGGIPEMAVVEPTAFAGGDENNTEVRRQAAEPGRRKPTEGGGELTTKIGQARWMPSLTVDPPDGRLFWIHGGPSGSGCGGEAGFRHLRRGPCGRPATGRG